MEKRAQPNTPSYHQEYFRPSCMKALNLRFDTWESFAPYSEKNYDEIQLPIELTETPEDTLLNYFSILRDAENVEYGGCGTVGEAHIPFPIAYNFLSQNLQSKLNFQQYVASFNGIGHTSLLKLFQIPDDQHNVRFFYEIETIEGVKEKKRVYFGYSYGFIKLTHENSGYRIDEITKIDEDFLCVPYHGWDWQGEAVVEIKFGNWCKLIKHLYPTQNKGYLKYITFYGNDGAFYCFIFATLTNGTDIEIAQYRKQDNEGWKVIHLKPELDCLDNSEI